MLNMKRGRWNKGRILMTGVLETFLPHQDFFLFSLLPSTNGAWNLLTLKLFKKNFFNNCETDIPCGDFAISTSFSSHCVWCCRFLQYTNNNLTPENTKFSIISFFFIIISWLILNNIESSFRENTDSAILKHDFFFRL